MGEKISWTLNVQVQGGPKISASDTIDVHAYDKIEVLLGIGDDGKKEIEIQPSSSGDQVQFILICSDYYDDNLTYKVSESSDTDIKLDSLQLLMGDGAVGFLGATTPTSLHFTNGTANEVSIQILVGRNAIA